MTPYYEQDGIVIYHGDCREILPALGSVDHTISDPPYARDVYVRLSQPNTKAGSGTPGRLSVPLKGKQGRKIHDLQDGALARMAAGDIGSIDEMLAGVAAQIARLTKRWALVFSDAETTHRWRAHYAAKLAKRVLRRILDEALGVDHDRREPEKRKSASHAVCGRCACL